jgi:hypothetical protein
MPLPAEAADANAARPKVEINIPASLRFVFQADTFVVKF